MTDPVKIEFDAPIQRESVAEMVVRRILDMVKAGVLKAGDTLPPERDLALSLNVSRPSVREAMRKFSAPDVAEVLFGAVSGACSCSDVGNEEVQKAADSVFNATWLPLQYGGWKPVGRNARQL